MRLPAVLLSAMCARREISRTCSMAAQLEGKITYHSVQPDAMINRRLVTRGACLERDRLLVCRPFGRSLQLLGGAGHGQCPGFGRDALDGPTGLVGFRVLANRPPQCRFTRIANDARMGDARSL